MKTAKRFLSMLLALCCVLGMLPNVAFAANDNASFADVNQTDWFADAVRYAYEKGMMNGTSADTFAPNDVTTRSMIVTILHRLENTPSASGETFSDVSSNQWYADAVAWASANKIVNGYGNGMFGPNDPITREQMTAILYRYSQIKNYDVSASGNISEFADAATVSTYAKEAMSWAIGAKLISGVGNQTLAPKGNATRAQIATILMRYCENIAAKPTVVATTYTVIFDKNDNSASREEKTVESGETVSKPADPSRTGYTFDGWYTEKTGGNQFDFTQVITADLTLYAHWSIQRSSGGGGGGSSSGDSGSGSTSATYTVSFETNGGSTVKSQTIQSGGTATEPTALTKDGYTFGGWYTDTTCNNRFDFATVITASMTLYAKWNPETSIKNGVTVTFYLNDGSEKIYETQTIEMNTPVKEPTAPIRDMYRFTGWYTEPQTAAEYNFDTPVTENISFYAGWGNPDGTDDGLYSADSGGGTKPSINGIEHFADSISVTINTPEPGMIMVEFLDEEIFWNAAEGAEKDLPALKSIVAQTPDYCEMKPVAIPFTDISNDLPKHYVMRATLYDKNDKLLCDPFYSIQNTAKYEEFDALTVEDRIEEYGEDRVVVFDNADPNNNYGVFAEDIKEITTSDAVNTLSVKYTDIEDKLIPLTTYRFDNIDETVKGLQVGAKILALDKDGYPQLFQIDTIVQIDDTAIEITPNQDIALTDFYEVVKANMNGTQTEVPDNVTVSQNGVQLRAERFNKQFTLKRSIEQSINWEPVKWLKVSGSLKGEATIDIDVVYDKRKLKKDYFKISLTAKIEPTFKPSLKADFNNKEKMKEEWKGLKKSIPTPVPGLSVFVLPSVPIETSLSGTLSATVSATIKCHLGYDSVSGFTSSGKVTFSNNIKIDGKAEVKLGPKIAIGVAWLEKVVEGDLSFQAGLKLSASSSNTIAEWTNEDSKHGCEICFSGKMETFKTAKASLSSIIPQNDKLKGKFEAVLYEVTSPIRKCYFSILHPGAESVFVKKDGKPNTDWVFGWGDCPNKIWRTTFKAQDDTGNELNIPLHIARNDNKVQKDGTTPFTEYLYNGKYTAKGTEDNTEISQSFTVKNAKQEVTVTSTASDAPDTPDTPDIPDTPSEDGNIDWRLDDDGTLTIFGMGKMKDYIDEIDEDVPWASARDKAQRLIIEDGITHIGEASFTFFSLLDSVTIPNSVTSIGGWAFQGCSNLEGITIPDSVTTIGEYAFSICPKLRNVKLSNNLKSIEPFTFAECDLLNLTIPNSVTSLGICIFSNCKNLISIALPKSVRTIDDMAFSSRGVEQKLIVYYAGSQEDWKSISITNIEDDSSHIPWDVTIIYNSVTLRSLSSDNGFTEPETA